MDDDGRRVEIPSKPQRVVFLDEENAAHVTSLGYVPYGVAWNYGPDYVKLLTDFGGLTGDLSGVRDAGKGGDDLDLEKILVLKPDLIIGWSEREAQEIERLSAAAPFVGVNPRTNRTGKEFEQARFLADLVGVRDVAERRITEYTKALESFRTRYADELAGLDYSYLDYGGDGSVYMYNLPGYAINAVMTGLQVPMAAAMKSATDRALGFPDDPDSGYAKVSIENATDYAADLTFVGGQKAGPVPDDLGAVLGTTFAGRNDQVFPVPTNQWTFHLLESNFFVLGEVEKLFAEKQITAQA